MARTPFYGRGPGPAIARMDMQAATAPGRAYAQMFANLGKTAGDTIKQYGLNKEKQKKNQAFIKGQSNLLGMLEEQDPEQAARYATMKEQLNDPDVSLSERAELGKQLMQNITLTGQMKDQMINRETKEQALGLAKQLESTTVENAELRTEVARLTKDSVVSGVDADARMKESAANISEIKEPYVKDDMALDRENRQSAIDYRKAATLSMFLKQNNINAPVPKDLEKRFSEIATLLGKNNDSTVKVRTSGLFGGDEVEIPYSEYKQNPDEYAPLVNDRIKVLQANEERLRKEQTNVMQGFKIPITDKETGEQIFITLLEKMEYDEKRKQLQDERDLKLQGTPDQRSGYMSGMNMDYSNLDPSEAELMAAPKATRP